MKAKYLFFAVLILSYPFLISISGFAETQNYPLHLMPIPATLEQTQGIFRIQSDFRVAITGYNDSRLKNAVIRMLRRLQLKTGMPPTNRTIQDSGTTQASMQIDCRSQEASIPSIYSNEAYSLEVMPLSIRLSAETTTGVLRGLETFLQLVDMDSQSFFVPLVKIDDRPRFPWRGLLIDASRHWEPVAIIKRNLDAMAALKMNVLHWHLSDDQGFRVESRVFPKLHQIGSEGNYYTQAQIRDIITYAQDRGIRIVPEFDMPGHVTAWLTAYPELASAPGPYSIERSWGVFDPSMDPTQESVYSHLDAFIGEMSRLFPDEYFHIGGDEVTGKQWNASKRIQAFKKRKRLNSNRELQSYFNQRLQKILTKHGKRMIGWDEILHPDLPKSVTVQTWRSKPSLVDSVRQGYEGILSRGYYLDHMQPAAFHYEIDPVGKEAANLTDKERIRILGGEACMWGEFVNEDTIESRIWPRAAAIAERLWSSVDVRDVSDMYRRLDYVNRELELLGLTHRSKHFQMLQRMTDEKNITPLVILAGLLKPVGIGTRQKTQKYYSSTPLNRLADILLPESDTARQLESLVDQGTRDLFLTQEVFQQIRKLLVEWQENRDQAKPILEQSFLLRELIPVSETIYEISALGLQALDFLETHEKPPEVWIQETSNRIKQSEQGQAEVQIAIIPAIKKLFEAAIKPGGLAKN
jgi:hexosaminidase